MSDPTPMHSGAKIYGPLVLRFYDLWVLGVSNHLFWKCPTRDLLQLYERNIGARHLDIGVGTGWYLDHIKNCSSDITLVDLNENSLAVTAKRIARLSPKKIKADALKPLPLKGVLFDSVALMYLLHCLPGEMSTKVSLFSDVEKYLAPGGTIFGATILGQGFSGNIGARTIMNLYNRKGLFCNQHDDVTTLESALQTNYDNVVIRKIGCVTAFAAKKKQ
jgi:ubiquinone/menaquinone biosynthesis C-methylase UbiE